MSLITELDELSSKKKYQSYMIEMGIDKVSILIPFEKRTDFVILAKEKQPSSRRELNTIVSQFGGLLEEVN